MEEKINSEELIKEEYLKIEKNYVSKSEEGKLLTFNSKRCCVFILFLSIKIIISLVIVSYMVLNPFLWLIPFCISLIYTIILFYFPLTLYITVDLQNQTIEIGYRNFFCIKHLIIKKSFSEIKIILFIEKSYEYIFPNKIINNIFFILNDDKGVFILNNRTSGCYTRKAYLFLKKVLPQNIIVGIFN